MMLKGSDEWQGRTGYAETFYKRAAGLLPEMEFSKAAAMLLEKEVPAGDSILDVGCGGGHYLRSLRNAIAVPFRYTGVGAMLHFVGTGWPQGLGAGATCTIATGSGELAYSVA